MITKENESREEHLAHVGRAMMAAARTAPKGCGVDNLEIAMVTGEGIAALIDKMRETGERAGKGFFLRDAGNVGNSDAVVLIGVKPRVRKLDCGLCGYPKCAEKEEKTPATPCSFDVMDLGIAIGSAVSVAADHRIDNRVMYSAGVAARELKILEESSIIIAIPLSCTGKSIYFDRKSNAAPPTCAG